MKHLLSPSILNGNFLNLQQEIEMLNSSKADWIHLDIMDGVFVPNLTIGFPVINQINSIARKPLDVHLMIVNPDRYIQEFKDAGASILTIHSEACSHLHRTIDAIKEAGMKAGVSINPHTPVNTLSEVIENLDLVLIMSVNPGFGGQSFIEHTYPKVAETKQLITNSKSQALIEVDGGVDLSNARKLIDAGVDVLVVGSSIFRDHSPLKMIERLKEI